MYQECILAFMAVWAGVGGYMSTSYFKYGYPHDLLKNRG